MKISRIVLIVLSVLVAFTSFLGGFKLITTNGMGMPLSALANTPFVSFVIPGLILFFIVGGTQLLSVISQSRKCERAPIVSAVAAFGLLIWIFVELFMMLNAHWLQALYFGIAIVELILILLQMKYKENI